MATQQRLKGREMIVKIPDLAARPMLLAYIEDLVKGSLKLSHLGEIYALLIDAWLERERAFVGRKDDLLRFSELLAYNLFVNRAARGMEKIPEADLQPLAESYGIALKNWQLRGRSLLNRDAIGNYKFAHRSIMEYLYISQFLKIPRSDCPEPWTDLMKQFLIEKVRLGGIQSICGADLAGMDLRGVSFRGMDLSQAKLADAVLRDVDFVGATLTGVSYRELRKGGACLSGASLRGVALGGERYDEIEKTAADLSGVSLQGVLFHGAAYGDLRATGADLRDVNLLGVLFKQTPYGELCEQGANLEGVNLRGVIFDGVQYSELRVTGAELRGVSLRGVLFNGTPYDELSEAGVELSGVNLCGVAFDGTEYGDLHALVPPAHGGALGADAVLPARRLGRQRDQARGRDGRQAVGRLELTGNADEQAMQVRDAIRVLFPEAVTLVREAREGLS